MTVVVEREWSVKLEKRFCLKLFDLTSNTKSPIHCDWNDLAAALALNKKASYDVVVVDETQDFSANEIRAVMNQLAEEHTVTFVWTLHKEYMRETLLGRKLVCPFALRRA